MSMKVHVRFFAYLAVAIGRKEKFDLEVGEGINVGEVVDVLTKDAKVRENLLEANGTLKPDVTILVNGREIKFLSGMDTALDHGDEISIFPPVVGG